MVNFIFFLAIFFIVLKWSLVHETHLVWYGILFLWFMRRIQYQNWFASVSMFLAQGNREEEEFVFVIIMQLCKSISDYINNWNVHFHCVTHFNSSNMVGLFAFWGNKLGPGRRPSSQSGGWLTYENLRSISRNFQKKYQKNIWFNHSIKCNFIKVSTKIWQHSICCGLSEMCVPLGL